MRSTTPAAVTGGMACTANLLEQLVPNLYLQTVVKQSAKELAVVLQGSKRVFLQGQSVRDIVLPSLLDQSKLTAAKWKLS